MLQKLSSLGDAAARRRADSLDADVRAAAHLAILRGEVLYIRRARLRDEPIITGMLDDAKQRLRRLGTDQWSTDWEDKKRRNRVDRMRDSLRNGTTWLAVIVLQDPVHPKIVPVASVALEQSADPLVWSPREAEEEPAIYLSRLVVAEGFSGLHIGAAILDWAGRHAREKYGATCVRLDVWTTNKRLHHYYDKRSFKPLKLAPDKNYPSRARFQRSTSCINGDGPAVVELDAPSDVPRHAGSPAHPAAAPQRNTTGKAVQAACSNGVVGRAGISASAQNARRPQRAPDVNGASVDNGAELKAIIE